MFLSIVVTLLVTVQLARAGDFYVGANWRADYAGFGANAAGARGMSSVGWTYETYVNTQGCTETERVQQGALVGGPALRVAFQMAPGSSTQSQCEINLDVRWNQQPTACPSVAATGGLVNAEGVTVRARVCIPATLRGNGYAQIFLKDYPSFRSQYSDAFPIEGGCQDLQFRFTSNSGFNASSVVLVGVKIAVNRGSAVRGDLELASLTLQTPTPLVFRFDDLPYESDFRMIRQLADAVPGSVPMVRVHSVFGDGRNLYRPDGSLIGLTARFFRDFDAFVQTAASKTGLQITASLLDYLFLAKPQVSNVKYGGNVDVIRDPAKRQEFLDQVLEPLVARYSGYPITWEPFSEPEFAIRDIPGLQTDSSRFDLVSKQEMQTFVAAALDRIRRYSSRTSIGSARRSTVELWPGVSSPQFHWYDSTGEAFPWPARETVLIAGDLFVGEAPTASTRFTAKDFIASAKSSGLTGGVGYWGCRTVDSASNIGAALASLQSPGMGFAFADRGGTSMITAGSSDSISVGYGAIQTNPGSTSPAAVAIFAYHSNGVLISEASVPASLPLRSGRMFAEIGSGVNTGLAIANPNDQTVQLDFEFVDENGARVGNGTAVIAAAGQVAVFLDQAPFNGPKVFRGSFSFTATAPVAAIALRGVTNERSEFLITTIPIADLMMAAPSSAVFPHFADGGGWTTQLVLVNPSDSTASGVIQFFSPGDSTRLGLPIAVSLDGQNGTSVSFSLPARGTRKFVTAGIGQSVQTGSIRVVPAVGSATPSGVVVFTYKSSGITVTEAGVPAASIANTLRAYVESSSAPGQPIISSGIAVVNPANSPVTVDVELTTLTGAATAFKRTLTLSANGQTAAFLNELFPNLPSAFQGILRASSQSSGIGAAVLRGRVNERGEFLITALPTTDERTTSASAPAFFPHLVDGGGYTTQMILFSANQSNWGTLRLFSQTGQLSSIPVR